MYVSVYIYIIHTVEVCLIEKKAFSVDHRGGVSLYISIYIYMIPKLLGVTAPGWLLALGQVWLRSLARLAGVLQTLPGSGVWVSRCRVEGIRVLGFMMV